MSVKEIFPTFVNLLTKIILSFTQLKRWVKITLIIAVYCVFVLLNINILVGVYHNKLASHSALLCGVMGGSYLEYTSNGGWTPGVDTSIHDHGCFISSPLACVMIGGKIITITARAEGVDGPSIKFNSMQSVCTFRNLSDY